MSSLRRSASKEGAAATPKPGPRPLDLVSNITSKKPRVASRSTSLPLPNEQASTLTSSTPFNVCVSGLSSIERQHVQSVVRRFGGTYLDRVSKECSFLVAHTVGSDKYVQAVERSVPIVSYEFIRQCDLTNQVADFRGFLVKPFSGLFICTSGLDQDERESVKQIVTANGGLFELFLSDRTTHLILAPRGFDSEKHKYARKTSIKITSMAWIDRCIDLGAWCEEKQFQPVAPPAGFARSASILEPVAETSKPIDETTRPDIESLLRKRSASAASTAKGTSRPMRSELEMDKETLEIAKQEEDCGDFLMNMYCYVECPHSEEHRKLLHSLAIHCGAFYLPTFNPEICTHVLVVDPGDDTEELSVTNGNKQLAETIKRYVEQCPSVRVVTSKFLRECVHDRTWLTESSFDWFPKGNLPLKKKKVCVSGYEMNDRLFVKKQVELLGGIFTDVLSPSVDILICGDTTTQKYQVAQRQGMEIQDLSWLRKLGR